MEGWLSLCFIALWMLLAIWFLKPSGVRKQLLPPGPWKLPILGSLHHVLSFLPHRKLMELSGRHGPVMFLRLGEIPTVVVSDAEAAALVMKTNDLSFASRPCSTTQKIFGCDGKDIALAPYSAHWRQLRRICLVELLSSKQVSRMEGIRAEEVGNLLRSITATSSTGATINVSKRTAELANDIVCRAVFGGKFTQQEEYLRDLEEALVLLGGFCLIDLFPSSRLVRWLSNAERHMRRSCGRIHGIIANVMDERRAVRSAGDDQTCGTVDAEDLLDVLLRLQQEDSLEFPLTTEVISAVLFDMFVGGTDTSSTILEWTLSELVRHPQAMAKAQQEVREVIGKDKVVIADRDVAELDYMRMVIKEVLRLHPPVPLLPRLAREDSTIMPYNIPKGTNICINVFAISRDPRYWKNPQEFKPERFENKNISYNGTLNEFIPFGAGRRQCPGIQFGSSVVEIALANLLYHFDWMLPDGASRASLDMSEKFGITVNRKYDLKLIAIPHGWVTATPLK
ncbi:hypothetical protein ACQ4PT_034027 [Festuca glaucescens]